MCVCVNYMAQYIVYHNICIIVTSDNVYRINVLHCIDYKVDMIVSIWFSAVSIVNTLSYYKYLIGVLQVWYTMISIVVL